MQFENTQPLARSPDGSSGGGGGGTTSNVRGIFTLSPTLGVPNLAAGGIFRQEAIIAYSEEYPGGGGHQITWFRSFYQGLHSGYRWLLPSAPCRYRTASSELFAYLEKQFNLAPEYAKTEMLEDLTILNSKKDVLEWTQGFEFDFDEKAIDHYLDMKWIFVGSQVYGTFKTKSHFYQIASNPLRIKTQSREKKILYPFILTGSSRGKEQKKTFVRLYIVTRKRIAQFSFPLEVVSEGIVEFDLGDSYVTVLEGELSSEQMKEDLVLELDHTTMLYQ